MTPSKQCKSNRIVLLGNEGNISEAHEGHRVNYGRELLPGPVTGEGTWDSCFLDWPLTFQHPNQAAFLVPGPSGESLPNPMTRPPILPASGPRLLKLRGKGLGKQLSEQIHVLCFQPGSQSARRSKPSARVVSLWLNVRNRYVYYAHLSAYLLSVFCRRGICEVL